MKDKTTAGILGILLGGIGAHKFYLDQTGQGVLYLVFCWTAIPTLIGFVEGLSYLTKSDAEFNRKYNNQLPAQQQAQLPAGQQPASGGGQMAQNITVNVSDDKQGNTGGDTSDSPSEHLGVAEELERLNRLRESGALTDEEFERQKKKLLS